VTAISPAICQRCGECCRRGGPALHRGDLPLLESGVISRGSLYTLRRGELARDPVTGTLGPLAEELVLVKGEGGQGGNPWACVFLQPEDNACRIYRSRPAECRALLCFDTGALEAMYTLARLTRFDIVNPAGALAELMRAHEAGCGHERLAQLARDYTERRMPATHADIVEMLRLDAALRELLPERLGQELAPQLDFYLGRPLVSALPGLGLGLAGGERLLVHHRPNPQE